MTRLIDNPDAQIPTTTVVDKIVLVELLLIASANDKVDRDEAEEFGRLADEVESGERVTLRVEEWRGMEGRGE